MKPGTVYVAEIPTHHHSEHRTERGAIAVLKRAERETGLTGAVVAVETSGEYTSRTVVYPKPGPTRTWPRKVMTENIEYSPVSTKPSDDIASTVQALLGATDGLITVHVRDSDHADGITQHLDRELLWRVAFLWEPLPGEIEAAKF